MGSYRLIVDKDYGRMKLVRLDEEDGGDLTALHGPHDSKLERALRDALQPSVVFDRLSSAGTAAGAIEDLKEKGYMVVKKRNLSPKGDPQHDDDDCPGEEECACELHILSDDCKLWDCLDNGCDDCPYQR